MLPPAESEVVEIAILPAAKLVPVPLPSDSVVVPVPVVPVPVLPVPVVLAVVLPKFPVPLQAASSDRPAHAKIDVLRIESILARRMSASVEI